MATDSITLKKSKDFAIRIVRLYKYLRQTKREYTLSSQLLRSGTSIGANLSEAIYGISYKDFVSKMFIALKECAETKYWLELLHETNYLTDEEYHSMDKDCTELIRLLTASAKSGKREMDKK
jgi:four helix bundle protein